MGILSTRAAPNKAVHDPLTCYIDGVTPCDACRASHQARERDFLERDAEARERWRLRASAERFAATTGIPQADLAAALLPVMADGIAEIAGAVMDEREATA